MTRAPVRGVLPGGFAYLDEALPGVRWDARYATRNNFTGEKVDGYLANRVVVTHAVCAALRRAQVEAATLGLGLYVWDAYRPQRAVDSFLRWSQAAEDGRTKQRYYPNVDKRELFTKGYVAARSAHSRGCAVDLTLYDLKAGEPLHMGTGFDYLDPLSRHGAPGVDGAATGNRRLLLELMESCGFTAYSEEWWHYALRDEPHPDAYFDFPIA